VKAEANISACNCPLTCKFSEHQTVTLPLLKIKKTIREGGCVDDIDDDDNDDEGYCEINFRTIEKLII
jgi:hypothetical protein